MIDYAQVVHLYLICGKTDLRKGIDGLVQLVVGVSTLASNGAVVLH